MKILLVVLMVCEFKTLAIDIYSDENFYHNENPLVPKLLEFEPVNTLAKSGDKIVIMKNLDCDSFTTYAKNCTVQAALMYNYPRQTPPEPDKIGSWCKALRHLASCAMDWNTDCNGVSDSYFNNESIRGHLHVIKHICDDEEFLMNYRELDQCVDRIMNDWEVCYSNFKILVDEQKNSTNEWTHYETHFYLCCARAQFRRCTLDNLFLKAVKQQICTLVQATILQRYSVIVSEGDVFQNCDRNVMYPNCPGGDPRPLYNIVQMANRASVMSDIKFNFTLYICYVLCVVIVWCF